MMFDRYDVMTVVWEELKHMVKNKENKENKRSLSLSLLF